jgi:hypothetical protein
MESVTFGRWTVNVNRALTEAAYAAIAEGSPEKCVCDACQNFVKRRDQIYPLSLRELFARLGIDWRKEAEIYYNGEVRPGVHSYGGWFHFIGRIEAGHDGWKAVDLNTAVPDFQFLCDGFSLGFTNRIALLPDPFRGQQVVQVEFLAETRGPFEPEHVT